jgi:hypothetical protein
VNVWGVLPLHYDVLVTLRFWNSKASLITGTYYNFKLGKFGCQMVHKQDMAIPEDIGPIIKFV